VNSSSLRKWKNVLTDSNSWQRRRESKDCRTASLKSLKAALIVERFPFSQATIPGLYAVANMDPAPGRRALQTAFDVMRELNEPGKSPDIIAEFYNGWFTGWGDEDFQRRPGSGDVLATLPNFILYMAHGGTNFGFSNGANANPDFLLDWALSFVPSFLGVERLVGNYQAQTTSYDYDAPVGETGNRVIAFDGVDKFQDIRDALGPGNPFRSADSLGPEFAKLRAAYFDEPPPIPVAYFDKPAELTSVGALLSADLWQCRVADTSGAKAGGSLKIHLDALDIWDHLAVVKLVPTDKAADGGLSKYRLRLHNVRDRVYVYTDKDHGSERAQWISRPGIDEADAKSPLEIQVDASSVVYLLVEDFGRVNFWKASMESEFRGFTLDYAEVSGRRAGRDVDDGLHPVFPWTVHVCKGFGDGASFLGEHSPFGPGKTAAPVDGRIPGPRVLWGSFDSPPQASCADTHIDVSGPRFGHGIISVNGYNLGRYNTTRGPQRSLFVPGCFLKCDAERAVRNEVRMVELENLGGKSATRWSLPFAKARVEPEKKSEPPNVLRAQVAAFAEAFWRWEVASLSLWWRLYPCLRLLGGGFETFREQRPFTLQQQLDKMQTYGVCWWFHGFFVPSCCACWLCKAVCREHLCRSSKPRTMMDRGHNRSQHPGEMLPEMASHMQGRLRSGVWSGSISSPEGSGEGSYEMTDERDDVDI